MVVQWDFTRRDHPGNPGGISGSGSVNCCALELILPIAARCLLNLRCVLAKAALHTKIFKSLSLKRVIKLLER